MITLRAFISTLLIFLGSVYIAESQTIPFRTFSIESGLSESVIHSLVQDDRGYIWAATGYGLNRFDGERFKQYYEEQGLADNVVNTLHKDTNGTIWVGTDSGISILQGDSLITPNRFYSLNDKSVLDIYDDTEGNVWIATAGDGVWVTGPDGELMNLTNRHGYRSVHARTISQTPDGRMWFGTQDGLMSFQSGVIRVYRQRDGLPDVRIRDLATDSDGNLWIGTRAGLAQYKEGEFTVFNQEDGLKDHRIQSVTITETNDIWVGTENGAVLYNGEEFRNFTTENGLPALIVYDILKDRENIVWFGTLGSGLNRYTGDIFHSHTVDNGLTNNVVTGFEEDSEGNIWIATYGGGVLIYDGEDMSVFSEQDGLIDNKVYTVFEDSQQRMWIGTREGINIYENGEMTRLNSEIFPFQVIRKIIEVDGAYWIGSYTDGLIYFDPETGEYEQYNIQNGLLNNTVMDIKVDEDGTFWVATYGGVAKFDGEMFKHYTIADGLPSNGVIHIHIDHNGDKWFSTFSGIGKLEGDVILSMPGSAQTETITYFMFQDYQQRYWVGTNRGLYHVKPNQFFEATSRVERIKSFRLYNQNQGLVANELNAGASFVAQDETIWLGTVEGLSHFYPARIQTNLTPPGIEFEEILMSGENVIENSNQTFNHDQNFLQIIYTGLSLDAPDQILYEYRLVGLEDEWQTSRERSVRYTSLAPNDYEFQIRAYNSDGIRSEKTASFSFTVLPPFYLSWLFITILILSVIGLILFFFRYFKVAKQVDIERMRVQIASDLHDDVGSSLTELALQTDFLQAGEVNDEVRNTLKQLGEHSRKIVTSLDDIVWSIDSRNDTAGDLTDRMQDYANQMFSQRNIELNFDFDELNMDEKLPVDVKENVYLIFKEAINNIVKHSNANQVDIKFSFEGKTFELLVRDNGKLNGAMRKSGQGLRNIKMRADRINSNVNIENDDGFIVHAKGSLKQTKL